MADDLQEEEWLYGETVTKIEPTLLPPQIDENDSDMVDTDRPEDVAGGEGEQSVIDGENASEGTTTAIEMTETLVTTMEGGSVIKEEAGEVIANEDGGVSEEEEDEDSDDDDDGVQVVIGDIKAPVAPPPTFSSTKRPPGPPPDKKGKFAVEDFEGTGTINGVPAQDFSLDAIEEKPWRKPGADITDYFNYGFTEETWRAYCDRQKRLRYESGSALPPPNERERKHQHQGPVVTSIPTVGSDKYGGPPNIIFPKKFGMHDRGPKEPQRINRVREEPRENTIQVMTADRREYSRKAFDMPPIPPPFDMSVPPPSYPPPDQYHGGGGDFFNHPPPQYYREEPHVDYEEQQWMDSAWDTNMTGPGPSGASTVVPLVKVSNLPPPPGEAEDSGKRSPSAGGKDD